MFRRIVLTVVFLLQAAAFACGQEGFVRIEEPKTGDKVSRLPAIEGAVSNPRADVWVVVRPMETLEYWVQPPVQVDKDGEWAATVHIGRPGKDVGKKFEIRAIANPKKTLKEGDVLSAWPRGQWRSKIVEVTRK